MKVPKPVVTFAFLVLVAGFNQSCRRYQKANYLLNKANFKILWRDTNTFLSLNKVPTGLILYKKQNDNTNELYLDKSKNGLFISDDSVYTRTLFGNVKISANLRNNNSANGNSKKNNSDVNYSLGKKMYAYNYDGGLGKSNFINLNSIAAAEFQFFTNESSTVRINRSNINDLLISTKLPTKHSANLLVRPILNVVNGGEFNHFKILSIYNKRIEVIAPGKVQHLTIADCNLTPNSTLFSLGLDTLELYNVEDSLTNNVLKTSFLGTNFDGRNDYLPGPDELKKKKILILNNTSADKIKLNYEYWKYLPTGDFLKVKEDFKSLISSQKKLGNYQGFLDASIDSAKYEDSQNLFPMLSIPLKIWWNNYGYDKNKVIGSIMELFIGIFIVNFFVFKKLCQVYEFRSIRVKIKSYQGSVGNIDRLYFHFILCLMYTGYLFFGLKLELSKLKLNHLAIAYWIIAQYIMGIISVAYLANLIITK